MSRTERQMSKHDSSCAVIHVFAKNRVTQSTLFETVAINLR